MRWRDYLYFGSQMKKALHRKEIYRRLKEASLGLEGTISRRAGPVSINCMAPDYRDCLDRVMEEWELHKKDLRKVYGKSIRPSHYAFAYWLIRWSGLVQPAASPRK
jgi:hypothetical protein